MLYLFNAAGRQQYTKNILNVLCLPNNSRMRFQYSSNSSVNYVDDTVEEYDSRNLKVKKREDVLISFFDIEHQRFYPIRFAKHANTYKSEGKVYIEVDLGNFVPNETCIEQFQQEMIASFNNKLYKTNSTGEKTAGFLAFKGNTITMYSANISSGTWIESVLRIKDCKALKNCIFTKISLPNDSKIKVIYKNDKAVFQLPNPNVKITINYYYQPATEINQKIVVENECVKNLTWETQNTLQYIELNLENNSVLSFNSSFKKPDNSDVNSDVFSYNQEVSLLYKQKWHKKFLSFIIPTFFLFIGLLFTKAYEFIEKVKSEGSDGEFTIPWIALIAFAIASICQTIGINLLSSRFSRNRK